jgi:hypothetical protein
VAAGACPPGLGGETVAGSPYAIEQGSLAANSNYVIDYHGANLTITGSSEANAVVWKYNQLGEHEKQNLLNFLRSL